MSNIPSTSLVVNPDGVESVAGRVPDIIYLMAPAIKGGLKKDDSNLPILDQNGNCVLESKLFSSRYLFEKEFGSSRAGSPAAVYASWIYDLGSYGIRCRRVVGPDASFAEAFLQDAMEDEVLQIRSMGQSSEDNYTFIDVDASTDREAYLVKPNAIFDSALGFLQTEVIYSATDRIIFDGAKLSDNTSFRLSFFGDGETDKFEIFNWGEIASGVPFVVTDGQITYDYAGEDIAVADLAVGTYSWVPSTKELRLAPAPVPGFFNLMIKGQMTSYGEFDLSLNCNGTQNTFDLNFVYGDINFKSLFVNGIGDNFNEKFSRLVRLYTNSAFVALKGVQVTVTAGSDAGTYKVILVAGFGANSQTEVYDNNATLLDIIKKIESNSVLVRAAGMVVDTNQQPATCNDVVFAPIGVMLTVRNTMTNLSEVYDNLANVQAIVQDINANSQMVTAAAVFGQDHKIPATVSDVQLAGGSSGLNPSTLDYLDALAEAESKLDVTIIIAPGIDDEAFHSLMNNHCHLMSNRGYYRTTYVGGKIGETIEQKKRRTRILNSQRMCMMGDGLYLVDPQTVRKKLYAPSVAVVPFVATLVSYPFYTCLTYKFLTNAFGVENEYDDAQHNELHQAHLVTFRINQGIQIVDAITTSSWNAYEDIHTVRTFDVISRGVNKAMEKAIGRSNMPPTWAYVFGLIRRFLELLRDTQAIMDFNIHNEMAPQDLVDRRFRFRVGIVPVFPIKYVEGEIDIIPPTALPSMGTGIENLQA